MSTRADLVKAGLVVGWLALQGGLILTAGARSEHAFGFRMFGEASTLRYSLARVVRMPGGGTREIPCPGGKWSIVGPADIRTYYDWHHWVTQPGLGSFDHEIFASYGLAAQQSRLKAALESFASQVRGDPDTVRLILRGSGRRNGAPAEAFEYVGEVQP